MFVQAKFPLPTVSRPDGTLGGYVQYNANPRGDRFIWPAERIAIYQAQQAAKLAALKKQRSFSLLKSSASGGKSGVQTTANLRGLGIVTNNASGAAGAINQAVYDAGANGTVSDAILAFMNNAVKARDAVISS